MGWWWKLTVEWPGALGDAIWRYLVAMPLATLREMTVRKILTAVAIGVLVAMFAQFAAADLAYLLAGDMLTYLEAASLVWLIATRGRVRDLLRSLAHKARRFGLDPIRRAPVLRRAVSRRRRAVIRRVRRPARSRQDKDGRGAYRRRPGVLRNAPCHRVAGRAER